MAYSGKTQYYNLPQIEGTDKVNWFDLNGAFEIIDTEMESNKQESATANQKADNNTNAIAALTETVTNQGQTGVDNTAEIDKLKQATSLHTTHLNEIDVINQNQNTRIQALESEEADTGTEILAIKRDIDNINNTVTENTQNIANSETEIQALQAITDTLVDELGGGTWKKIWATTVNLTASGQTGSLPSVGSSNCYMLCKTVNVDGKNIITDIALDLSQTYSAQFNLIPGTISVTAEFADNGLEIDVQAASISNCNFFITTPSGTAKKKGIDGCQINASHIGSNIEVTINGSWQETQNFPSGWGFRGNGEIRFVKAEEV